MEISAVVPSGAIRLRQMDNPAIIPDAYRLGQKAAAAQMRREDLA